MDILSLFCGGLNGNHPLYCVADRLPAHNPAGIGHDGQSSSIQTCELCEPICAYSCVSICSKAGFRHLHTAHYNTTALGRCPHHHTHHRPSFSTCSPPDHPGQAPSHPFPPVTWPQATLRLVHARCGFLSPCMSSLSSQIAFLTLRGATFLQHPQARRGRELLTSYRGLMCSEASTGLAWCEAKARTSEWSVKERHPSILSHCCDTGSTGMYEEWSGDAHAAHCPGRAWMAGPPMPLQA